LTSPKSAITKYNGKPPKNEGWDFEDIYTPSEANRQKLIDVFVVHTAHHLDVELRPDFELWKYRFYEDVDGAQHKRLGIDPEGITVAIVRPDGMVGLVCSADEMGEKVPAYFDKVLTKK